MKKFRKHQYIILLLASIAGMSLFGLVSGVFASDDKGQMVKGPEGIQEELSYFFTSEGENYANHTILTAKAIRYIKNENFKSNMTELPVFSDDSSKGDGLTVSGQSQNQLISDDLAKDEEKPRSDKNESSVKDNHKTDKNADWHSEKDDLEKEDEDEKDEEKEDEEKEDVTNPKFENVDDTYFYDALFIGDSRIVGFGLYSGLERITVYADKGFQIYTMANKKIVDTPAGKVTVPEALAERPMQFKKVYLMFGLNEMGWGTDEEFDNYYYNVIDMVKNYEPDAAIYVQSIMHVTKSKSDSSNLYNNENIDLRNEQLRKIAETENVYYLDLNEIFTDEDGALQEEYTSDGIHLAGKYVPLWVDYLKSHAIIRKIWEEERENMDSSTNESTDESTNESTDESTDLSTNESTDESIEDTQN